MALTLAREGAAIAAIDTNQAALEAVAQEVPTAKIAHAVADVTDRPSLHNVVRDLEKKLGGIDVADRQRTASAAKRP